MSAPCRLPAPLKKGDTIGIFAPAGQLIDQDRFSRGLALLAEMGFVPHYPRNLWPGEGYLADSDHHRVHELHNLLVSGEIQGLMAARGGYGCLRLLANLDLSCLSGHPKALVGFSDISILLNISAAQAGVLCFHGPVVTSLPETTPEGLERLFACLTGNWQKALSPGNLEILRGTIPVSGQLLGGNLSSLLSLVGTSYDVCWKDRVILLEDIGEPLYRIDRMLSQLHLSGKLDQVAGILLGDFTQDSSQEFLEKVRYREQVWRRVLEITSRNNPPVWANIPSGHLPANLTLPIGAWVEMDPLQGELRFSLKPLLR